MSSTDRGSKLWEISNFGFEWLGALDTAFQGVLIIRVDFTLTLARFPDGWSVDHMTSLGRASYVGLAM